MRLYTSFLSSSSELPTFLLAISPWNTAGLSYAGRLPGSQQKQSVAKSKWHLLVAYDDKPHGDVQPQNQAPAEPGWLQDSIQQTLICLYTNLPKIRNPKGDRGWTVRLSSDICPFIKEKQGTLTCMEKKNTCDKGVFMFLGGTGIKLLLVGWMYDKLW